MVKNWQPIFEIQHGGRCHLEFSKIFTFDATFAFYVIFSTWQPIFKIQEGGGRYLEF